MTDEQLQEIEERANSATPGPWVVLSCGDVFSLPNRIVVARAFNDDMDEEPLRQFIAAARTDIPALLAEVRRLRACA